MMTVLESYQPYKQRASYLWLPLLLFSVGAVFFVFSWFLDSQRRILLSSALFSMVLFSVYAKRFCFGSYRYLIVLRGNDDLEMTESEMNGVALIVESVGRFGKKTVCCVNGKEFVSVDCRSYGDKDDPKRFPKESIRVASVGNYTVNPAPPTVCRVLYRDGEQIYGIILECEAEFLKPFTQKS